jgi:hypothetical protein
MNPTQLKRKHNQLAKKEPFSPQEAAEFSKKDRAMIRNVQILNKIDKDEAIKLLRSSKGGAKVNLKKLAADFRKNIKTNYPQEVPEQRGNIPKVSKKKPKRTVSVLNRNRKDTLAWLKEPKNKSKKVYRKVEKGHKKYLDASRFEILQGINSKKSQAYRIKNGLNAKYEGRVVK